VKVQNTIQFKIIHPNKSKALSLNTTMRQYRKCVNFYLHEIAKGTPLTDIYQQAKKQYKLQTGIIQTARDIAKEQYDSYKNNPDNKVFPHFKGLMTTRFDHRSISLKHTPEGHYQWWANISTINGKVRVPITSCEKHFKLLQEHDFKCTQLKYKNGDFYLNIIFEENKTIPKQKDFKYFIGVDRGSHNNIATVVVQDKQGNILESRFFNAQQMLEKRRRFFVLRRQLGRKKLLKEIKKSKDKESNYVRDVNHKISTEIVCIASKYQNAVIVLENLKNIRKQMKFGKKGNRIGHSWSFLMLEEMIMYKAHRNSIAVRRVYPRGTSSVCKNCFGEIKRSPSILAVCKSCKKKYNADWLGAVNITRRFFFYMSKNLGISESCPEQGKDEFEGSAIAPNPFVDLAHRGLMARPIRI
jgi:IS605 OrfB family transposase